MDTIELIKKLAREGYMVEISYSSFVIGFEKHYSFEVALTHEDGDENDYEMAFGSSLEEAIEDIARRTGLFPVQEMEKIENE